MCPSRPRSTSGCTTPIAPRVVADHRHQGQVHHDRTHHVLLGRFGTRRAQRLGNIGQPPYDPSVDTSTGWLVLEVSSFQAVDLDAAPRRHRGDVPRSDHIDWHGSLEQYRRDKLSLTRAAGAHHTLVADSATLRRAREQLGGEVEVRRPRRRRTWPLHSDSSARTTTRTWPWPSRPSRALTGVDDRRRCATSILAVAENFEPLRGRLTLVAARNANGARVRYVDDGLATSVLPTLAASRGLRQRTGGPHRRGLRPGVDYGELAEAIVSRRQPTTLITSGNAGLRLSDEVRRRQKDLVQHSADSMLEAVSLARESLHEGGVVLLSPAAPSFDRYHNWEERSEDFTHTVRSLLT